MKRRIMYIIMSFMTVVLLMTACGNNTGKQIQELIQRGSELIAQQQYEEGISVLEEAYALAQDNADIISAMETGYGAWATDLVTAGSFPEAVEVYSQLREKLPDSTAANEINEVYREWVGGEQTPEGLFELINHANSHLETGEVQVVHDSVEEKLSDMVDDLIENKAYEDALALTEKAVENDFPALEEKKTLIPLYVVDHMSFETVREKEMDFNYVLTDENYEKKEYEGSSIEKVSGTWTINEIKELESDQEGFRVIEITTTQQMETRVTLPLDTNFWYFVSTPDMVLMDAYTGQMLASREMMGDDSFATDTLILWNDKEIPVHYESVSQWNGGWTNDNIYSGNSVTMGWKKSCVSVRRVTIPADYDGLVIAIEKEPKGKNESYSDIDFTIDEGAVFFGDDGKSVDDYEFIRVTDMLDLFSSEEFQPIAVAEAPQTQLVAQAETQQQPTQPVQSAPAVPQAEQPSQMTSEDANRAELERIVSERQQMT